MKPARRLFPLLVVASASFAILPAAPARGWPALVQSAPLRVEAHFNDVVQFPAGDPSINQNLVRLIDGVPNTGTIRGAFFDTREDSQVPDALRRAKARGVTLMIVQDKKDKESLGLGSSVRRCDRFPITATQPVSYPSACNSSAFARMHSKFLLFSSTYDLTGANGRRSSVVWIGSHNATGGGGGALSFNNALVFFDNQELFNTLRDRIWSYMWNWTSYAGPPWGTDFLMDNFTRGFAASLFNAPPHVFASPEAGQDIVATVLSNYRGNSGCRVRVMQNRIYRRSGTATGDAVSQLVRLKREGCYVEVLIQYLNEFDEEEQTWRTVRTDASTVQTLRAWDIPIRAAKVRVHDKVILVNSAANGAIVLTGSHNLAEAAAHRNDELLLVLPNFGNAHGVFLDHFARAWNAPGNGFLCTEIPHEYCPEPVPPGGGD
jgi:PLD-like domain